MAAGSKKLSLARKHLKRVQVAWSEPTDWDDLFLYGFYCLEAATEAAALHFGIKTSRKHWEKAETASKLHANNGLPDVADLLLDLNSARKAAAYGDVEAPELNAEEVAVEIEAYVEAVAALIVEELK